VLQESSFFGGYHHGNACHEENLTRPLEGLYGQWWKQGVDSTRATRASWIKSNDTNPNSGIVTISSHRSVEQTVEKLEAVLHAKGVKLFAVVDHSGEAKMPACIRPTSF
jgi:hypothetical protein